MISKAQVKQIRGLVSSKGRTEQQAFSVEGDKLCREWLTSAAEIVHLFAEKSWLEKYDSILVEHPSLQVTATTQEELQKVATQQHPNQVILIAKLPQKSTLPPKDSWCLALDRFQDPGNMGTLIRIADWFGIRDIVCSPGCVDVYNPKVLAAAMGGHLRVTIHHTELGLYFIKCTVPVLAATMSGTAIHQLKPKDAAVLLIGNESQGIHPSLLEKSTETITIPRRGGAESLNAAVAAGIILSRLVPVETQLVQ